MNINSTELPDMPILAVDVEAGFILEVNTIFHNLNDKDISASTLYVFLLKYFIWTSIPSICKKNSDFSSISINVQHQKTFNSLWKKVFSITISVLSYKSTQLKYDVLILVTVSVFTDSQKKENVMVNFAKKNAKQLHY